MKMLHVHVACCVYLVDEVKRAPLSTHHVTRSGADPAHERQQLELGRERRGELEQRLLLPMEPPLALKDLRVEQTDAEEAAECGHHLLVLRSEALAVALVEALRDAENGRWLALRCRLPVDWHAQYLEGWAAGGVLAEAWQRRGVAGVLGAWKGCGRGAEECGRGAGVRRVREVEVEVAAPMWCGVGS